MDGNSFLSYIDFKNKYSNEINFVTYYSLITAISRYKTKIMINENVAESKRINYQPAMAIIFKHKRGASYIYSKMIHRKEISKGIKKWWETNIFEENLAFLKLKTTTQDTKLRWFQFRILHNIITTNLSVSKFNPDQSHLCEFCKIEKESIKHLFWECSHVKRFWNELEKKVTERNPLAKNFKVKENLILFGIDHGFVTDTVCDLILLLGKFFIYRCKVQKINLSFKYFLRELYSRYLQEKHIHMNSNYFQNNYFPA